MKLTFWKVFPLLTLAALVPLAFGQGPAPSAKRTIEVREALVTMLEDVQVPATEMGMLTAIHIKEGQQVDEETLLADIDNRESIARQLIAQGELEAAQAQA